MATPASLSPGPDPGRRAPPQHRCASALAAAARPGGGSSSWAPARESPRSCTSSRRSRLRRSWRPRSRETWLAIGRRYLRNISRRLRAKHRSVGKGSLTSSMAAVDDDTARERAEAVARAISYCKDTLRRSSMPPPPSPSPSLDDWLLDDRDRQEVKIIASAAEQHCDDCRTRDSRPSPTRSRRDQDAGWPIRVQTMVKRFKESPCSSSPSRLPWRADEQLGRRVGVSENIRWGRGDDQSPFHHCGDPKKRLSSVQEAESARYEKEAIRYEKKKIVSA
ncbi:unnamed protein product [Miscanthus lutarioriparius]|uniref:Uncharacterized protein n=1 Tax=Miscanthus lutarioriparius TaxID=422564 RepID=A0A811S2F8_9POAL|nr:unnamed protein product [Miscanthus lutarioriparius]